MDGGKGNPQIFLNMKNRKSRVFGKFNTPEIKETLKSGVTYPNIADIEILFQMFQMFQKNGRNFNRLD